MVRIRAAARRGSLRMWSIVIAAALVAAAIPCVAMGLDAPASAAQLAGGWMHSLALRPDGTLLGWGTNYFGQVGDGTNAQRLTPVVIGTGYSAVSAGALHSLGLKADGTLMAWGHGGYGQLGDGLKSNSFVPKVIDAGYMAVSAGANFSLGLKADGTLLTWGTNYNGELGDGTRLERTTPAVIGSGYKAISAGGAHSLALRTDGTLVAWGNNLYGQLGDGMNATSLTPKVIGTGYVAIAAGADHSLGLKSDGTLQAWGLNANGQLGDGTNISSSVPKDIGVGFVAIDGGNAHSLGITADGTLMAWGYGANGALGPGSASDAWVPTAVGAGYDQVSAGSLHTLALGTDGVLQSWGYNGYGALGNGGTANAYLPVTLADWGAPVSSAVEVPGWSTVPVSLAISASDGRGSGVAQTWYRFGDGPASLYPPCDVTAEGATTVWFWSVDVAGNVEAPKSTTVMLDTIAPVTTVEALGTYVGQAEITAGATDAGSGVADTVLALDGQRVPGTTVTVTDLGAHVLEYHSVDVAGNTEAVRSVTFQVVSPKTPTALTIAACDTSVRYLHTIELSGALQPGLRDDVIAIEAMLPGSTTWTVVATRYAGWPSHTGAVRWSYDYRPKLRGTYAFRATFAGDDTRQAGTSPELFVTVR